MNPETTALSHVQLTQLKEAAVAAAVAEMTKPCTQSCLSWHILLSIQAFCRERNCMTIIHGDMRHEAGLPKSLTRVDIMA
jgi:hypothetical protein